MAKSYKRFYSIYVQQLRLQNLEKVLLLQLILLDNINTQLYYQL